MNECIRRSISTSEGWASVGIPGNAASRLQGRSTASRNSPLQALPCKTEFQCLKFRKLSFLFSFLCKGGILFYTKKQRETFNALFSSTHDETDEDIRIRQIQICTDDKNKHMTQTNTQTAKQNNETKIQREHSRAASQKILKRKDPPKDQTRPTVCEGGRRGTR